MIIGISGKAQVGKNKLDQFIREEFKRRYNRKFYEAAFAFELKNMCKFQFGLSDDQLWGNKKEVLDERFVKPFDIYTAQYYSDGTLVKEYWTPREIMQEFGAFYRKIQPDFWVNGLKKFLDYEALKSHKDFIITDVRYKNEAEFIKGVKGFLIRIDRNLDNKIHGANHKSETELDNYNDFDMCIDNNGDLADLKIASYNIVNAIVSIENLMKNGRII